MVDFVCVTWWCGSPGLVAPVGGVGHGGLRVFVDTMVVYKVGLSGAG